jgi:hypothetical protein
MTIERADDFWHQVIAIANNKKAPERPEN